MIKQFATLCTLALSTTAMAADNANGILNCHYTASLSNGAFSAALKYNETITLQQRHDNQYNVNYTVQSSDLSFSNTSVETVNAVDSGWQVDFDDLITGSRRRFIFSANAPVQAYMHDGQGNWSDMFNSRYEEDGMTVALNGYCTFSANN